MKLFVKILAALGITAIGMLLYIALVAIDQVNYWKTYPMREERQRRRREDREDPDPDPDPVRPAAEKPAVKEQPEHVQP